MGYSEAALEGIKENGRAWKATITGIPEVMDAIRAARSARDVAAIDRELRKIAAAFKPHIGGDAHPSAQEALDWFEHESAAYEMENDLMHEWVESFDYWMGELYDFADYARIWVKP